MSTYDRWMSDLQSWEQELVQPDQAFTYQSDGTFEQAKRAIEMRYLVLETEFIKQRVIKLGMLGTRQYHKLPLPEGHLETFTAPVGTGPSFLRVTHNVKRYRAGLGPHVEIDDYILGLKTHSLATYSGEVWLNTGPTGLPPSSPPVIWRSNDGAMRLYNGSEYAPSFPSALDHYRSFEAINEQRQNIAVLEALLKMLGETSLEATYTP